MTAEANLTAKDENRKPGFLVPLQALLPAPEANQGYAFVYDPKTSTVKKTPIHVRGTEHKKAIVDKGLADEDIIAVAGVSFSSRWNESQTDETVGDRCQCSGFSRYPIRSQKPSVFDGNAHPARRIYMRPKA